MILTLKFTIQFNFVELFKHKLFYIQLTSNQIQAIVTLDGILSISYVGGASIFYMSNGMPSGPVTWQIAQTITLLV